jgi:choline transport protein
MSAFEVKASSQLHRTDSKDDAVLSEKKGTENDQRDMNRMGKKQEFRRNFGFVSIFGYSMTLMATWETLLT